MQRDIDRVLIGRKAIAQRIEELARTITRDFSEGGSPDDAAITLVPILTGSIIFVSDLIRHLPLRMQIRMVSVSSYPGSATVSKGARLQSQLSFLPEDLSGSRVLVMDDILDSGDTLRLITDLIRARRPSSVHTCVLLRKLRADVAHFPVDYVCFDIPDEFVVGYGLDFNDHYRNLPDIVTLRKEVIQGRKFGGFRGIRGFRGEGDGLSPDSSLPPDRVEIEAADAGELERIRADAMLPADLLQPDETIILLIKPSPWFILLEPLRTLGIITMFTGVLLALNRLYPIGLAPRDLILIAIACGGGRLFWQFLEWMGRTYVLTDRRVIRVMGVVRIQIFETQLSKIQNTNTFFSLRERIFGLGTIGFATAGTAGMDAFWRMVARPLEVHQAVVKAIERYR